MITDSEILEVRKKADIVDIISEYIDVVQKGKNYFSVCPFHDDHNPSMSISKEKQIFNCFTCNTGGNVFTFVMKFENISFPESVKLVANKVGINISYKEKNTTTKYTPAFNIMDLTKKYYINNLNTQNGINAKKYLNNRGISDEAIKIFEIGYALDEKNNLINFLTKQNYLKEDLVDLGLLNKSGPDIYDSFRNRIMIPISNLIGQTVGFTGRIFNNEDLAKYINTKETEIFKKGNILFNYSNAKNYIKNAKKCILVEGNMDVIKMFSMDIKNVVALMGTALTNEQITALKNLRVPITLLLDNDNAGLDATIKIGDVLLKNNINCEVIRLTGAKDPDEYIEKFGVEALKDNITHAIKFIDFKINLLKQNKNLNSVEELADFIKNVMDSLKYVDDLTQNITIDKISKDYNIDINILKQEIIKTDKKEKIAIKPSNENTTKKNDKYSYLANVILYYIASDYKYARIYKSDLNFFKEKIERAIASEIDYFHKNNQNADFADFLTYITHNDEYYQKALDILNQFADEELEHQKFLNYLKAMKKNLQDDEIKELKLKIKNELDTDKKIQLINKLTVIKKGSVDYERN